MRSFRLSEMSPRHLTSSDSICRPTLSFAPISIIFDAFPILFHWLESSYQVSRPRKPSKIFPCYLYGPTQYGLLRCRSNEGKYPRVLRACPPPSPPGSFPGPTKIGGVGSLASFPSPYTQSIGSDPVWFWQCGPCAVGYTSPPASAGRRPGRP